MRKEIYVLLMASLISLGVLLVALQPQTVIGQQYAVGGEIISPEAASPESFLTSQTIMAIMAIAAAAAAAGVLINNKRRL